MLPKVSVRENECCKEGIKADVRVRGHQKGWGTKLLSLTLVTACACSLGHSTSFNSRILQFTIYSV